MVMPRGWRISAPSPCPRASGTAPRMAAAVVIMMGRKRRRQASWMASRGGRLRVRAASMAKSIIMMAFFLTMPQSSSTPMRAMTLNSMPQARRASRAPMPADGRVERMVSGWMRLS